jgi:spore maturation protein CgeD
VTVDVLMTSFDVGHWLQQAIDSVLEQTHEDWRLMVMDDGSTDPLVAPILAAIDDPRITVQRFTPTVEERRATVRYATLINWGVERTSGEYLSYLASDDFYLPDRLERMVGAIEGRDVVYGSQLLLDKDDNLLSVRQTEGVLTDAAQRVDHNSVLHTRESFLAAGGWPTDPALWVEADAHFFRRLNEAGYPFYPVEGPPLDAKRYRPGCVGDMVPFGREPWT